MAGIAGPREAVGYGTLGAMSLLRVFEEPDYWPEYSTLVIRDVPGAGRSPGAGPLLALYAVDTQPSGSLARAGDGWLEGVASDNHHAVRVEVHDAPPAGDDLSEWDDALETPFVTGGTVSLGMVTGGTVGEPMELGAPGLYRVEYARRPVTAGAGASCRYRLRCWPVPGPPEPPRWLRRSRPLVDARPAAERGSYDGSYRQALTDVVMLVLWAAESGTPVTLGWLADRLSTTAAVARAVVEHPRADTVLTAAGDLDDPSAELTVDVHARPPTPMSTVPVKARAVPAKRTAGHPASRTTAAKAGVPMRPARPAIRRPDPGQS